MSRKPASYQSACQSSEAQRLCEQGADIAAIVLDRSRHEGSSSSIVRPHRDRDSLAGFSVSRTAPMASALASLTLPRSILAAGRGDRKVGRHASKDQDVWAQGEHPPTQILLGGCITILSVLPASFAADRSTGKLLRHWRLIHDAIGQAVNFSIVYHSHSDPSPLA